MAFEAWVAQSVSDPLTLAALEGSVERGVEFAQGRVEVRRHALRQPVENVCAIRDDVYSLNLALSRRPPPTTISHLGPGGGAAPQTLGRVALIPPGSMVRVSTPTGESRSMHVALKAELVENLLPRRPEWTDARFRFSARIDSRELEWLLLKIYRELTHRAFGAELVVESLANAVAVELIRSFRLSETCDPAPWKGGLAPWRMRLIRERVCDPGPTPRLAELAELCGMTVRQLAGAFKAETGQTIGKFVEAAMLERARALLADTALPIADISRALGFSHPASFSYAFRRATGFNPSEVEGRRARRLQA
jgi:AraC-like DNA-binding protein